MPWFSLEAFLVLEQKFLPYMGMADRDHLQIYNSPLTESSIWSLKKIGPGVTKEKFKGVDGWTDGRTDDGHRRALSQWLIWAHAQVS